MLAANPRDNSAPGFCWCVSHTLRGVVPRAGLERVFFEGVKVCLLAQMWPLATLLALDLLRLCLFNVLKAFG